MDVGFLENFISNVGFPIVSCCIMAWYVNRQTLSHEKEMDAMASALNNNTLVLQKLCDRLEEK